MNGGSDPAIGCELARPSPVCMGLNPCTRTLEHWGSTCSHLYLAESHRCRLSSQDADHNPAVHSVLHLRVKLITSSCARGQSADYHIVRALHEAHAHGFARLRRLGHPMMIVNHNCDTQEVSLGSTALSGTALRPQRAREQTPSLRVLASSRHERLWLLAPLHATRSGRRRGASAGFEVA